MNPLPQLPTFLEMVAGVPAPQRKIKPKPTVSPTAEGSGSSISAGPSEPAPRKRTGKACTRCRRYRQKCLHEVGAEGPVAPCEGCVNARQAADCVFTPRGKSAEDRVFRRKRPRVEGDAELGSLPPTPPLPSPAQPQLLPLPSLPPAPVPFTNAPFPTFGSPPPVVQVQMLPPHEEVVEGVKMLCFSYFQLGFIAENVFLEKLERDPQSISIFLLLSILTVSARFSPMLVARFGSRQAATEAFASRALSLIATEMLKPSVERAQAFCLLATSDWGQGFSQRSWMLMGIAVRMVGILRLHREETYLLPPDASPEEIINAELARRTFWIIYCHDDLTSTLNRPSSFSVLDITALLPCAEEDLAFGQHPVARAALVRTGAALADPASPFLPSRSMFASMLQTQSLWARVARQACTADGNLSEGPWEPTSWYAQLEGELKHWESTMPERHKWSTQNLRGMRVKKLDLALLSVALNLRLSHIVLARMFLPHIAAAVDNSQDEDSVRVAPPNFWSQMMLEMVGHSREIIAMAEAFFTTRSPLDGFPSLMVFGIFIAGDLASYLWRWPQLCPHFAPEAEGVLVRSVSILADCREAWPIAARWHATLLNATMPPTGVGRADLKLAARSQQDLDKADGIYRHDLSTEEDASSSSIASVSPVNGFTPVATGGSPPLIQGVSLNSPSSLQTDANLLLGLGGANPATTYTPSGLVAAQSGFNYGNTSTATKGGAEPLDAMLFDSLGADLAAFLQGDAMPGFETGYQPERPFAMW